MAESDYYNAGDSNEPSDRSESSKDDSDMQETALVPASMFPDDCEVGDTYTVKVVAKHDSELEIKHVRKKKDEKKDKDSDDDKDDDKPRRRRRHDRDHNHWREGDYLDDDANRSIDAGIAKMGMMT